MTTVANRTTFLPDGSKVVDQLKVDAFLETISNGNYTSGNGMGLSVNSATPDQQSIAVLAGVVGDLGKSAMAMAARTNTAPQATNAPAK